MAELSQCIKSFTKNTNWQANTALRFCFFIDGLDEYDGDHEDVIQLLHDLARGKNVKICASSRP